MLTLNIRGATVTIPEAEIERLWLASLREEPKKDAGKILAAQVLKEHGFAPHVVRPRIGSLWNGGVYAGIVRGGESDYHLIASNDEIVRAIWGAAKTWASNLTPYAGRSWRLPIRRDQAVLYGNLPELFAKEWYWSGEEYAPVAASAWAQSFGYGGQLTSRHVCEFRARAVLHIPVGEE